MVFKKNLGVCLMKNFILLISLIIIFEQISFSNDSEILNLKKMGVNVWMSGGGEIEIYKDSKITPNELYLIQKIKFNSFKIDKPRFLNDKNIININLNVESMIIQNQDITEGMMKHISQMKKLFYLDISHCRFDKNAIRYFSNFEKMETIYVRYTNFDDDDIINFNKYYNLKELSLDGTNITDKSIKNFPDSKLLRGIGIAKTKISIKGLYEILDKYKQLNDVGYWDNPITDKEYIDLKKYTDFLSKNNPKNVFGVRVTTIIDKQKRILITSNAVIKGNYINIRQEANTKSHMLIQLHDGEKVYLIKKSEHQDEIGGENHHWYYIEFQKNGKTIQGWVYGKFIKIVE